MSRASILHVDDDSNDVVLFQHACQKARVDFNVHVVADGDEAIAYLSGQSAFSDRSAHPFPRLILLDLKMPRVSGFELLSWMRQQAQFRCLPVVVLTSSNHEEDVKRAYEMGANSYLVKPVDFNALVELAGLIHQYWFTLDANLAY